MVQHQSHENFTFLLTQNMSIFSSIVTNKTIYVRRRKGEFFLLLCSHNVRNDLPEVPQYVPQRCSQ